MATLRRVLAWVGALLAALVAALWAARRLGRNDGADAEARAMEEVSRAGDAAIAQAQAELAEIHRDPDPVRRDDRRRAWIRAAMDAAARRRGRPG